MGAKPSKYAPLLQDEPQPDVMGVESSAPSGYHRSAFWASRTIVAVQSIMNLLLLVALVSLFFWTRQPPRPLLYSPADYLVKEKVVSFRRDSQERPEIYRANPSPEVDQAWEELYG
ncbi:hypothetical protein MPER_11482, partial [Moniliophthora perniciosa FA553]